MSHGLGNKSPEMDLLAIYLRSKTLKMDLLVIYTGSKSLKVDLLVSYTACDSIVTYLIRDTSHSMINRVIIDIHLSDWAASPRMITIIIY